MRTLTECDTVRVNMRTLTGCDTVRVNMRTLTGCDTVRVNMRTLTGCDTARVKGINKLSTCPLNRRAPEIVVPILVVYDPVTVVMVPESW